MHKITLPEKLIPVFERQYDIWDKESKEAHKDYSFHVPNASSIIKKEVNFDLIFGGNKDLVGADFLGRFNPVKRFFPFWPKPYPKYDDSDKFMYVLSTIYADIKFYCKYIKSINEKTLDDRQLITFECTKVLASKVELSPSVLWIYLSCVWMAYDADKSVQMFDVDVKRGRKRCLEIIKNYFT